MWYKKHKTLLTTFSLVLHNIIIANGMSDVRDRIQHMRQQQHQQSSTYESSKLKARRLCYHVVVH